MRIDFKLSERLVGFAATAAGPTENVAVVPSDLIPPSDAFRLTQALEHLQSALFGFIPGFPPPAIIDHLLLTIRGNLSGVAYINELNFKAQVKVNRALEAGSQVYLRDIDDILSFEPNVEVPDDCAVVVVRSSGWKRSLYFDFRPLEEPPSPRAEPLGQVLARPALLLWGIPARKTRPGPEANYEPKSMVELMADGYQQLRRLLDDRCQDESSYQQLLEEHPWMLGGQYESVQRHLGLDDENIPDFTATRSWDQCHEILELKQPFMKCFRSTGELSSDFNDAWNQAERYIAFTRRQRDYLREEKKLRFENARCILIAGYEIKDDLLRKIREKESIALSISVLTYDQLINVARHVLYLMRLSGTGGSENEKLKADAV
jgi:hypothetical protein